MADKEQNKTDDRRFFVFKAGDEERKYFLGMPTSEQIKQAEWHYSKVYNKALIDGVATEAEMTDILRKRGIYGEEHEKKVRNLQYSIAAKTVEMEQEKDDRKRHELAVEVSKLRDELYQWNQRLTGPLSNTCEQMANDAKTEYLTSAVVQKEDGSAVWASYDAFLNEPDQALSLKARFEVLLWLQGLDSDFLENTPENKVMRDLADKEEQKTSKALAAAKEDEAEEQAMAQEDATEEAPAKTTSSKQRKSTGTRRRKKSS